MHPTDCHKALFWAPFYIYHPAQKIEKSWDYLTETIVVVLPTCDSDHGTPRVGGRATMVEGIVPRLTLIGPHVSIDSLALAAFLIFLAAVLGEIHMVSL